MPDELEERESDLTSLADMWGKPRHAWPPEQLAPGVVLRRIPLPAHAKSLREALTGKASFLVPYLEDPRPFYAAIALRNYSEEDDAACAVCRGAKYVRYERPPGHTLFGQLVPCKVCFAARQPAAQEKPEKRKGEPWWSR